MSRQKQSRIHILTGENGTGKTTVLLALASVFEQSGSGFSTPNLKKLFNKET